MPCRMRSFSASTCSQRRSPASSSKCAPLSGSRSASLRPSTMALGSPSASASWRSLASRAAAFGPRFSACTLATVATVATVRGVAPGSVASVARFSAEMMESREESGSVVTKQQHGKFASGDSASPATLSGVLRHLRQLSRHQADQRLTRAKCRKTRCDSVATLATLARQRSGRRS